MSFEDNIAALNEAFFFREFTFAKNTFRPTPQNEFEFADNILWIDDLLVVFQIKERHAPGETTVEAEEKWFTNNVIGEAKRQIRNTLDYLKTCHRIHLENQRGHAFDLATANLKDLHKVIIYLPHSLLPQKCLSRKYYRSSTAGIIHLLPAHDYLGLCKTLITPTELADYLKFREELINNWEKTVLDVPEQALVGQYLVGDSSIAPNEKFLEAFRTLKQDDADWNISGIIRIFADRITTENPVTDYYPIVTEVAKLKRSELREFKTRLVLSMQKAEKNELAQPFRIAFPRTGCGFVFIPVTKDLVKIRINGLKNLTLAHKYDLKLEKCLGVSVASDGGDWFLIDWCFIQAPWEPDQEIDRFLKNNNPFRKLKVDQISVYSFKQNS
jgi:hypothetical protein